MPWTTVTVMDQRIEFIRLASLKSVSMAELCRRFGISCKTGYKWLSRSQKSPGEEQIVCLRNQYPRWGARKLQVLLKPLLAQNMRLPAVSTIHRVLMRHQLVSAEASEAAAHYIRFEHERPNALWQMDYKGHFELLTGIRCHPLTVLDDHSRFNLVLRAAENERTATVQQALTEAFRRFGLPERMTMDNGAPWGSDERHRFTPVTVWLMRLGIRVSHSRAYHPQTQGKDERFHRTLKSEVLADKGFATFLECQNAFDNWREIYNNIRPHEGINLQRPADRYRPSPRSFPESIPPIVYDAPAIVRKVQQKGKIHFLGKIIRTHRALKGQPVAFLPTEAERIFELRFGSIVLDTISMHQTAETIETQMII